MSEAAIMEQTDISLEVWGAGDLVGRRAVGICGARSADPRALEMAERFGRFVAKVGFGLVAGDARGIDDAAQYGALVQQGWVVSVLAEGLGRWHLRKRYRELVHETNYAAVSEFAATDTWQVWRAMKRNGTIVGLAEALVVVQAGTSGGTWNAGLECIRQRKPLIVVRRQNEPDTEGNSLLIAKGGIPVSTERELFDLLTALYSGAELSEGRQDKLL